MLSTLNLTVTTLADPGPTGTVSLRQAITTANADMTDSQEVINFAPSLNGGTIDLMMAFPNLANNISITGPGASNLTLQRDSSAATFSVFTVNSGETVNISGVTITGGDAVSGGGGGINNNGVLTAANDIFTGNSAGGNINVGYVTNSPYGGGGINSTGTLIVNNSTFADNIAGGDGGGIYTTGASTITNSIFNGNTAACAGGIYNNGAETVSGSTFENSIGSFYGGGIWNDYSGTLTVNDSTFANNTVAGTYCAGGAIFGPGAQMIVNNSTFIDNSSQWAGGAICNYTGGEFIVTNSTITNNSAYAGEGGGIQGSLTLNNTIVAGNVGGDISGQVQPTSSNNPIGNGTGITNLPSLNTSNLIGTTVNPINPLLGPLANNGGSTQTMALLPGSPAINAGSVALAVDANNNPLVYDQRGAGFPRIVDGTVDIGAYKFSPPLSSQTISFGPLKGQTYGVAPITLSATDTSGLPVSFSVFSGPATLSGSVLTVTGMGNVVVEASQAGSGTYSAATPVDESFTVAPASLTVTATNESMTYGGTVPTLTYAYTGLVNKDTSATFTGSLATTATSSSNVGDYPITQGTLAATGNYTINTFNPGTLTVIAAPLTVTTTNETAVYGTDNNNGYYVSPLLSYTYSGLVNNDTSATFVGSLEIANYYWYMSSPPIDVGTYTIIQDTLAAIGNYTIGTFIPGTLSITPATAPITIVPYSVTYDNNVHNAAGNAIGIEFYGYDELGGLVINSTHTDAGIYVDKWTFSNPDYNLAIGTFVDTIAKANSIVVVTPYSVVYNDETNTATGTVYGLNNVVLTGLNLNNTVHTNASTYTDTWTFYNPNYNSASSAVVDTIAKAGANIVMTGYNTFYNAEPHMATGTAYGINGVVLPGLNLNGTTHINVGTYTDVWTFTDITGNYNNASGTVVDAITPSKSKMVKETVNVPKTTVVKATILVPGIKEVKIVERVQVNGKWIKKTVLVPETVMVKKTVLVNETKMVHKTEMVQVYYS